MQHIDAAEIATQLPARLKYLQSFLGFDPETDGALIHACKPVLGPLVGDIVDAVYDHLLKYDITAAAFAPPQAAGQQSIAVHELTRDSEQIKFRKNFLKGYLIRLASNTDWAPESNFWAYLDGVGKAHTGGVGDQSGLKHRKNKPALWVDYRDVNLLLGWVENAVTDIVMGVESLDLQTRVSILKALNKLWWIQNDLFARHYVIEKDGLHGQEDKAQNGTVQNGTARNGVVQNGTAENGTAEATGNGGIWSRLGLGGS